MLEKLRKRTRWYVWQFRLGMGGIPRLMYEKLFIFMRVLGFAVLLTSYLLMLGTVIMAFLVGNWNILYRFNDYGEGLSELILYLVSVPCVILYLRDKRG